MAGRKAIEWSAAQQKQFKDLCSIFCTRQEICVVMGVSEKTLNRLINKYFHKEVAPDLPSKEKITFEDAFEYYSATGRASLRREQFRLAMTGDKQMLTWLGKQYLEQSEKTEVQNKTTATIKEATAIDKLADRASSLGMPSKN